MEQQEKQRPSEFDEANLLDIKTATVSLLDTAGFFVFKIIKYITRKWMYLALGLILGGILGYIQYRNYHKMLQTAEFSTSNGEEEYAILLSPKYNSIDYLDQLVQVKFSDKLDYTQIKSSKLEGIDDVFSFLGQDSLYPKIFENLIGKVERFDEAIHNYAVSKNYPYQLLKIKVAQPFEIKGFISDLQTHFNQHPYFAKRKQIELASLTLEKETLEEELKGIHTYGSLLDKKQEILKRLKEIEIAQLESQEVLYVVDYIAINPVLATTEYSIERKIAKDLVKVMLLFFVLGMAVDFVRYYKNRT